MANRRYGAPFWWVPYWTDTGTNLIPGATGLPNTGANIVGVLIDTNVPSTFVDQVPDQDTAFLVERIVGQRLLTADEDPAATRLIHERVYVADSNESSVTIRDLESIDEAKSSFLWHQVSPWASTYDGDQWGHWQASGGGNPDGVAFMGRYGHFDIPTKRVIESGSALVWHLQLSRSGGGVPADDTFSLALWCRILLRMAL